jgi:hypothetical protein
VGGVIGAYRCALKSKTAAHEGGERRERQETNIPHRCTDERAIYLIRSARGITCQTDSLVVPFGRSMMRD